MVKLKTNVPQGLLYVCLFYLIVMFLNVLDLYSTLLGFTVGFAETNPLAASALQNSTATAWFLFYKFALPLIPLPMAFILRKFHSALLVLPCLTYSLFIFYNGVTVVQNFLLILGGAS